MNSVPPLPWLWLHGLNFKMQYKLLHFVTQIKVKNTQHTLRLGEKFIYTSIWLSQIRTKDVDYMEYWSCEKTLGSQCMHSIALVDYVDITFLKHPKLTSFCLECMDGNFEFVNKKCVMPWTLIWLDSHLT